MNDVGVGLHITLIKQFSQLELTVSGGLAGSVILISDATHRHQQIRSPLKFPPFRVISSR